MLITIVGERLSLQRIPGTSYIDCVNLVLRKDSKIVGYIFRYLYKVVGHVRYLRCRSNPINLTQRIKRLPSTYLASRCKNICHIEFSSMFTFSQITFDSIKSIRDIATWARNGSLLYMHLPIRNT